MAQTAVEWLQESLLNTLTHQQQMQVEGLFQQAKAMEKEQIKDAYANGSNDRLKNRVIEYYNEKYGGK
jgi:ribosomal protein S24E